MADQQIDNEINKAAVVHGKNSFALWFLSVFTVATMASVGTFAYFQFSKMDATLAANATNWQAQKEAMNQRMLALMQTIDGLQKNVEKLQQTTLDQAADAANSQMAADVFARLAQLNTQIDRLPLPSLQAQVMQNPVVNTVDSEHMPWWRVIGMYSMQVLSKMVTVKYIGADAPPVVTPEAKAFVYQNLHAQVENAMWAALHHQPEVYQLSLSRMVTWIKRYFANDAPQTVAMLQALGQLSTVVVGGN